MHWKKGIALTASLLVGVAPHVVAQGTTTTVASAATSSTAGPTHAELVAMMAPAVARLIRDAGVGPGKTVVFWGGASQLPMMERLAIESERAGAATHIGVTTDDLQRVRYLGSAAQRDRFVRELIAERQVGDVIVFNFPSNDTNAGFDSLPPAQQQLIMDAGKAFGKAQEAGPKWRDVWINLPTPTDTAGSGMTLESIRRARWAEIAADPDQMIATGTALRARLSAAKKIRVTSPDGTDFTFVPAAGRGSIDPAPNDSAGAPASALSYPRGSLSVIGQSATANGRLRAPWDICAKPVTHESVDVDKGIPANISGPGDDECVRKTLAPLKFGFLQIGLNPGSTAATTAAPLANGDFSAVGLVLIGFGMSTHIGGDDPGPGLWEVPVPRATVLADGVAVVRDGRILVSAGTPTTASAKQ